MDNLTYRPTEGIESKDIRKICKLLPKVHRDIMSDMNVEQAINYLYMVLDDEGIDPDEFLEATGIIES